MQRKKNSQLKCIQKLKRTREKLHIFLVHSNNAKNSSQLIIHFAFIRDHCRIKSTNSSTLGSETASLVWPQAPTNADASTASTIASTPTNGRLHATVLVSWNESITINVGTYWKQDSFSFFFVCFSVFNAFYFGFGLSIGRSWTVLYWIT